MNSGALASRQVGNKTIKLVWIGGKGDWVYLRKVPFPNPDVANVLLRHMLLQPALPVTEFAIFALGRTHPFFLGSELRSPAGMEQDG